MTLASLLSESQIRCLKLVADGLSTKEIARSTGWSPNTVDKYISTALPVLGVTNRREAARLLDFNGVEKSVYQPDHFLDPDADAINSASEAPGDSAPPPAKALSAWLPPIGGKSYDLSQIERLKAVGSIALISTLFALALVVLISGGVRLLSHS